MAIKTYRPITSTLRFKSTIVNDDLTTNRPYKPLTKIKQAVQQVFKVKVESVKTANFHGKERRRGRFAGHRPDWKKAYVRLKVGEKMPEYADNA